MEAKTKTFTTLVIVLLALCGHHIKAQEYPTYYMDSISNEDTTYYCSGSDSIRFIARADAEGLLWFINSHADTLRVDTFLLPYGYEGLVAYQSSNIEGRYSYFYPLIIDIPEVDTIICGGTAHFNITSNITDTLSYKWSPSTGLNFDTIPNPVAEVTTNTTYFVTVSTPSGCIVNDTVNVIVNPLTVEAGEDKSIVCGGSVQFDDPLSNYTGSGTLSYSWLPAEGLSDANIARPEAEITSDKTFKLSVSTPNGCTAKDSLLVSVNPLVASVSNTAISCGSTAVLNAETNYTGSGSLSYLWSPSDGLSDVNIANPEVTLTDDMSYSLDVNTANGCLATTNVDLTTSNIDFDPSICVVSVNEDDYNVIVWKKPQNTAIESFYVYRESSFLTDFYDLVGIVPGTATSVFIDSASDASVMSNKYKIAVTDVCGYQTEMSAEHKTMHLTINKGFSNTWNLIWESYEGLTVSNYKIYRGSKADNLSEIATTSGSNTTYTDESVTGTHSYYMIEMTLPGSCNSFKSTDYSSSRSNIISTGDASGISSNNISELLIFPNPVSDRATVQFPNPNKEAYMFTISDLTGKVIRIKDDITMDRIEISRDGLPGGVYLMELIGPVSYRSKVLFK